MRKPCMFAVIAGILTMVAAGAWGADDPVEKAIEACQPEIDAYCSQVSLGEGRLLACFYAHEDKLSGRCGYALYQAAAQLEDAVAAIEHLAMQCKDDLIEHCAKVEFGEGRVGTCLLNNKEKVSKGCAQAIDDVGLEKVEH